MDRAERGHKALEPGTEVWQSRRKLKAARDRALLGTIGIGVAVTLWLGLFFSGSYSKYNYSEHLTGFIFLEALTLLAFAFAVSRFRRANAAWKEVTEAPDDVASSNADDDLVMDALRGLERLTSALRPGPAKTEGRAALAVAKSAADTRRRLSERAAELERVLAITRSPGPRRALGEAIRSCLQDLLALAVELEEINAAVVSLLDAADAGAIEIEIERLRTAKERTALFAEGLDELHQLSPGATVHEDRGRAIPQAEGARPETRSQGG